MKKLLILVVANILLFADCFAADYRILKDTKLYDGNYNYVEDIQKDSIVQLYDSFIRAPLDQSKKDVDYKYGCAINWHGEKCLIDLDAILPAETEDLFDENIVSIKLESSGKYWTHVEDCDVLYSCNRDEYYKRHKTAIDYYEKRRGIYDDPWYENGLSVSFTGIYNVVLNISKDSSARTFVKKIRKIDNGYKVLVEVYELDTVEYKQDYEFFKEIFKEGEDITLTIIVDGDYLHIYTEENLLVVSLALVDEEFEEQYRNLGKTNTCDLSRITWPRHADGTCDYEVSATKPSIDVGTILRAADNLRLRSSEATSSAVITTMQKETRVKILQLGQEQTIDGIKANWVQVEVLPGAKDRDGNPIKAGTSGWCFGGYLLAAPEPEPVAAEPEPENTPEPVAAEPPSVPAPSDPAFPVMLSSAKHLPPLAAGGAAVLVIGAVVLIIVKKRKK